MNKRKPIPTLTKVIDERNTPIEADWLDDEDLELLVKRLEAQFQPLISEAIRSAVKDNARRMALDLRKRMDSSIRQLIRRAVKETLGGRSRRERQ